MTGPRYTPTVAALPASVPFVGPETLERQRGRPFAARIGANESIFGPSPKAIHAMAQAASECWMYGDPENYDLRHALATHYGIGADNIVVGEGIDGLLGYLVRLLVGPGDPVVTSDGAYPTFNFHVAAQGGSLHRVPYSNDAEDLPALIACARELNAKLVYFANPDNPMGTWSSGPDILSALDALPDQTVLLLDEAYVEFAPEGTAPALPLDRENVIRMRTFSKAYGMAGARVGYAMGASGLIRSFEKVRNHFGMSRIAQAGALAALGDQEYLQSVVTQVDAARKRIAVIAADNGLRALPSATNFVTIDCGQDGDYARAVLQALQAQDMFVRMPFVAPGDRCIRISCAPGPVLDLFERALAAALAAVPAKR